MASLQHFTQNPRPISGVPTFGEDGGKQSRYQSSALGARV
jgi:hypothetical protein